MDILRICGQLRGDISKADLRVPYMYICKLFLKSATNTYLFSYYGQHFIIILSNLQK